jgi:hypothetical protein
MANRTANNPAWQEWMTTLMAGESEPEVVRKGVSRHSYAATLPPDQFYCLLDELPVHLIPRPAFKQLQLRGDEQEALYLNPDCVLCGDGELPEELASRRKEFSRFALQGTVAWVRSTTTGNLLPFWLGPQFESAMRGLRPNEPAPSSVPREVCLWLAAAGILVTHDHEDQEGHARQRRRQRDERISQAAVSFREKGYAPLGDLIHPFHIAALRRYYRHLIRTGAITLGDGQSPLRYVAYNEPVARFFHHDIAAILSGVAGEPLKPSYVYMASYLSGAVLKKHTDRAQCEFSVTLCLDFSPEPVLETPWPIRLDAAAGTVTVHQALGDGLAYRGTRLPHYRGELNEGQSSTSIFFHYVAEDFSGSLD